MAAKTPKQIGTEWESAVRDYLQRSGWPTVERLPLFGSGDRGDLAGIPDVVIEAKTRRPAKCAECGTTQRAAEFTGWLGEAESERVNARAAVGVVWAKRYGKATAGEGFVVMTGSTFVTLLRRGGF